MIGFLGGQPINLHMQPAFPTSSRNRGAPVSEVCSRLEASNSVFKPQERVSPAKDLNPSWRGSPWSGSPDRVADSAGSRRFAIGRPACFLLEYPDGLIGHCIRPANHRSGGFQLVHTWAFFRVMASSFTFLCSDFEFLRLKGNSVKPVEADDVPRGLVLVHKRQSGQSL